MKYICKIVSFILLLPLMAVFCQTAAGSMTACIQCQKVEVVKQDCCANMAGSMDETGGVGDRKIPGECPHDGYCVKPVDTTPDSILIPNTPVEITVLLQGSSIFTNFVSADLQPSHISFSPPGNKQIHLFTLHCAYLI